MVCSWAVITEETLGMPIVVVGVGVGVGALGSAGFEGAGDEIGGDGAGGLETGRTTIGVVMFDSDLGPDSALGFAPEPWCAGFP
jgi:hypothetical protein